MNFRSLTNNITEKAKALGDELSNKSAQKLLDIIIDDKCPRAVKKTAKKHKPNKKKNQLVEYVDSVKDMSDTAVDKIKGAMPVNAEKFLADLGNAAIDAKDKVVTIVSDAEFIKSHTLENRDELCENEELKDFARIASHIYGNRPLSFLSKRWHVIEKFHDQQTELLAALYQYKDFDKYVIAFAGTRSLKDGLEDVKQIVGISKQFTKAKQFAEEMIKKHGLHGVTFVGHSQGGGEAAMCANILGQRAVTFNPAGVSTLTKALYISPCPNPWWRYRLCH